MPIVFICSPYAGDVETNIRKARAYSRFAVECGYIPIAPHLLFPQYMDAAEIAKATARNMPIRHFDENRKEVTPI